MSFDYLYYINKYNDIPKSENLAKLHFFNNGYKECRHPFNLNRFDINYYKINNIDLLNNNNLFEHYIKYGQFENRKIKFDNIKMISKPLITNLNNANLNNANLNNAKLNNSKLNNANLQNGLIYVYYERYSETFNQTNLAFFLKKIHLSPNCLYLFIINNYKCEVNIPKKDNIFILKNSNCYDFEAYLDGIKFFEKKFNRKIYEIFNNLAFMNCSVSGPFSNTNWYNIFSNKLNEKNVLVCPILDCLKLKTPDIVKGAKNPGYFFMIKCTKHIIELLTTPNLKLKNYSNIVFGKKKGKDDTIFSGEYGVSTVLLNNGYNICSLVNKNLDYKYEKNYNILQTYPDRFNLYRYDIKNTIFVKMNWRAGDGFSHRDSLPVCYKNINNEINKVFNIDNNYFMNRLNYSKLKISPNGFEVRNPQFKWKSKEQFYNNYGKAEEFIIYPYSNGTNLCILKHSDNENYFRQNIIQSIKYLLNNHFKILIFTTCSKIINTYIPDNVNINYNINKIDIDKIINNNIFNYNNFLIIDTIDYLFPLDNNFNIFYNKKWIDANTDNIYFFNKDIINNNSIPCNKLNNFSIHIKNYNNNNNNKFINNMLKYN